MHPAQTNATKTGTGSLKVRARTLTWDEIPDWQRDNRHIITGYRSGRANYLETLTSLTFLHNETCNIYTHLIGALLLLVIATSSMEVLSQAQFSDVQAINHAMFGLYFISAESCLVLSTIYHMVGSHSHDVEQFWLKMDLLGIVAVTVGTFIPSIYYAFKCQPSLQRFHWTLVSHLGGLSAVRSWCSRCANIGTDRCLRICYCGHDLCTMVSTLEDGEDVRLCCAWSFIMHSNAARSPTIWP